jgi:hypothetical protein
MGQEELFKRSSELVRLREYTQKSQDSASSAVA